MRTGDQPTNCNKRTFRISEQIWPNEIHYGLQIRRSNYLDHISHAVHRSQPAADSAAVYL